MNEEQELKFKRMTQDPVEGLIGRLSVPTIISMLITSFYNMADTFFVGKINTSATGAVGVVFSMMAIIQAVGFFFGHGSGNFISRSLGDQSMENAEQMAATAFFSALGAGFLIMVGGLLFLDPLSRALGSTETILPYTKDYMRFILFGAPYMTASLVLNNQLRFQGSAFYAMIGIATGAVLNIGLDPLFIFTFHMGVGGAALATILSQFASFCLLLLGTRKGGNLRIRFRNFTPRLGFFLEIIRGGLPSLGRQGLASIAAICLNFAAGFYGDAAVAAMSIVNRIMMFAASALIGFGQGFQPVCGFNYGARRYDRVRHAFWFCVRMSAVMLTILSALGFWFAPQLVALFRKEDAEVIRIGTLALRMQCLTLPLSSLIVLSNMMMQNIGKAVRATFLATARQGLFFIPLILTLPSVFQIGGITAAQPVADAVTFLIAIPLQVSIFSEMKKLETAQNDSSVL